MKKDKTIDFIRVIAILMVLIIHVANYYCRNFGIIQNSSFIFATIINIISRVSVPLFFMISGALLIPKKLTKEIYIKRIKKTFIVLIIAIIGYLLFEYIYLQNTYKIIDLIIKPAKSSFAHLWFLYVIIAFYITLPFINKLANNLTKDEENYFIILWFLSAVFNYAIKFIYNESVIYKLPIIAGTYYLGYFLIGNIIYKRKKELEKIIEKYNKKIIISSLISLLIVMILTICLSYKYGEFYNLFCAYSCPFIMYISVISYSIIMTKIKNPSEKITYFAKYSFGIYLIHGIILEIMKYNINLIKYNSIITIIPLSIILFFISYIIIYLLKKIPKTNDYI